MTRSRRLSACSQYLTAATSLEDQALPKQSHAVKPQVLRERKRTSEASQKAIVASQRTVSSYEEFAVEYDKLIDETPPPDVQGALRRMVALIPQGGDALEIGSGPGRDADFVETLGARVRRTDGTQAFLDIQAARGKHCELLNFVTDALGGPYDAVLALCTLIHVERSCTDFVLSKIAEALRPGGAFLVSMREGDGETSGRYHMTYWSHAAFATRLEAVGLFIECSDRRIDVDQDIWMTFLCRRPT